VLQKARLTLHLEHKQDVWPHEARPEVRLLQEWGLGSSPQEAIWVIAYDAQKHLRTAVEVSRGMHTSVDLHMPTLLAAVLLSGSERFMIAHNHPSGDPTPTPTDLLFTSYVRQAADVCQLYLEDHIIVTPRKTKWISMVDERLYAPPAYINTELTA